MVEPTFDAVRNFQYVTKWAGRPNTVGRISEFMRRAFTYLRAGRPGPVMLELPMDVLAADIDELALDYDPVSGTKIMAAPRAVEAAVKAIIAAKKPMIHAGVGILYAEWMSCESSPSWSGAGNDHASGKERLS